KYCLDHPLNAGPVDVVHMRDTGQSHCKFKLGRVMTHQRIHAAFAVKGEAIDVRPPNTNSCCPKRYRFESICTTANPAVKENRYALVHYTYYIMECIQ